MKNNVFFWVLLGAAILATALVMRSCSPTAELPNDDREKQLLSQVEALKGQVSIRDSVIQAILKKRDRDSLKSTARHKRTMSEIKAKGTALAALEQKVASLLDSLPELDSLVDGKNQIIAQQGSEIDSLQQDLITERETFQEFRAKTQTMERIHAKIVADQGEVITLLMVDKSKLQRKVKREKVLTALIAVGAFVVGVLASK